MTEDRDREFVSLWRQAVEAWPTESQHVVTAYFMMMLELRAVAENDVRTAQDLAATMARGLEFVADELAERRPAREVLQALAGVAAREWGRSE
jgi:hypothetical protein